MNWDNRYIESAKHYAEWSKDPRTKVAAVIIGDKGQLISQGYNGFPRGIHDLEDRLNNRETKQQFVVHAEMNAILNAIHNNASPVGCTLYVHGLPVCHECAKAVIQSGIKRVVYDTAIDSSNKTWFDSTMLALSMFVEVGIEVYYIGDGDA